MNKIKSPMVKVLRKAGYSTKEAMNITHNAIYAYQQQRERDSIHFNHLAVNGGLDMMFDWSLTDEGHYYWDNLCGKLSDW
ncbi:MAG: hypothetical protein [Bacteriophage sp.]|nr:MAG: hypothetical protein [Bacteriophage sp.]